ncbi:reverse transcriptase [Tanacetum coccineum]
MMAFYGGFRLLLWGDRVTTYRLDSVDWGKFGLPVYVVNKACIVEVIRILAGQPPISSLSPFMVGGAVDWCVMMSSLDASLSVGRSFIAVKELVRKGCKWNIGHGCSVNVPRGEFSCKSTYLLALETSQELVQNNSDEAIKFSCYKRRAKVPKFYETQGAVTMEDFCSIILDHSPTHWDDFMMILWGLWTRRNKHFHGQAERREVAVEVMAKRLLLDYFNANKKEIARRVGTPQTNSRNVWMKPQVTQIKFNCDAAWQRESGKVGMGFVARNCNGEVLLSGARSEFYANSPLEAEAKAIWWAIQHARSRCYPEVVFESDSLTLVHALRNQSIPLKIAAMFSDILSKSLAFGTCDWSFVKKEGNMVAHSIARWALGCTTNMVLECDVPSCASGLVSKDIFLSTRTTGEQHKGLVSEIKQLKENFRTHAGVLDLAQSVFDILYHYYIHSVDKLEPEICLISGEALRSGANVERRGARDTMWGKTGQSYGSDSNCFIKMRGTNHEAFEGYLREAALIFESIGKLELSATCYCDLGEYERTGADMEHIALKEGT